MNIFCEVSLHDLYADKCRAIRSEIEALTDEQISSEGLDEIVADILQRYSEECPEVMSGKHWAREPEGQRYQEEVIFEVHIPFKGEGRAFAWYHGSRPIGANKYSVSGNELVVRLSVERERVKTLDKKIEEEFAFLETYLRNLRDMIPRWNDHLKGAVQDALLDRNVELRKKRTFEQKMAGLSVPIRRRDEGVIETTIPMKRKALKPKPLTCTPERSWSIEQRMYEDILRSMESMVKVMERSPSTFCNLEEESLRNMARFKACIDRLQQERGFHKGHFFHAEYDRVPQSVRASRQLVHSRKWRQVRFSSKGRPPARVSTDQSRIPCSSERINGE